MAPPKLQRKQPLAGADALASHGRCSAVWLDSSGVWHVVERREGENVTPWVARIAPLFLDDKVKRVRVYDRGRHCTRDTADERTS